MDVVGGELVTGRFSQLEKVVDSRFHLLLQFGVVLEPIEELFCLISHAFSPSWSILQSASCWGPLRFLCVAKSILSPQLVKRACPVPSLPNSKCGSSDCTSSGDVYLIAELGAWCEKNRNFQGLHRIG